MDGEFKLDPRIAADSVALCQLPLCRLRLMNDSRFPWLILIPARPNLREIHAVEAVGRQILMGEIALVSAALQRVTGAEKMNIGALGNLVPQLHIHVVARFARDAAWPGPVWGFGSAEPYHSDSLHALKDKLLLEIDQVAPPQNRHS